MPTAGMMTSPTSDVTILPNAVPIITPTARSMTFPRVANFLKEFKKFATRGNVIDLAVGVIIGTAFGKIVTSLVGDVIMPAVGMILGKVDLKKLYVALDHNTYASLEAAEAAKAPVLAY